MNSRIARIAALALCLIAPLGWAAHTHAATTDAIVVTGQVVGASMSLSLSTNDFSFGVVDNSGASFDPAISTAEPHPVSPNPYSIAEGMAWFARSPVVATVTTPVNALISSCLSDQTNVIDATGTRIFVGTATGVEAPAEFLLSDKGSPLCTEGQSVVTSVGSVVAQAYHLYPVYLVRATDTPGSFSATIQIILAAI